MATTVFNTDNSNEDGLTVRTSVTESFATIIAANGNDANDTDSDIAAPKFDRSGANYTGIRRAIFQFDTSIIGTDVASVATFEPYLETKSDNMGGLSVVVVGCNPANANAIVAADYQTRLTTALSDVVTLASMSNGSYITFTFTPAGLAYINGAGNTPLMLIFEEDRAGTDPGAGTAASMLITSYEDVSNKPPKFTVTYAPKVPVGSPIFYQ